MMADARKPRAPRPHVAAAFDGPVQELLPSAPKLEARLLAACGAIIAPKRRSCAMIAAYLRRDRLGASEHRRLAPRRPAN